MGNTYKIRRREKSEDEMFISRIPLGEFAVMAVVVSYQKLTDWGAPGWRSG